ncbi:MAG: hypothetical protein QF554_01030 [Dehalococcoidia bacterium]|jgi:hypothetical protein|nr:hypothetical protein [Dehalococcoidia bacterium]
MTALRKLTGIALLALGAGVVIIGAYFIQQGFAAESEIKDRMADEAVTVKIDDVEYPVDNGERATAQALIIKSHTLEKYGPWQTLERGSDERASLLDGLTLRNSLNMARMGLDLSLMVKAIGGVFMVVGLGFATTGAVVYTLAARHEAKERVEAREAAPVYAV